MMIKRKTILALLTFMFTLNIGAQKLIVERFAETSEITASQYPRMDANGKHCAMVKVEVLDAVTHTEGGVVGKIVDQGNEKWVYFVDGQRIFKMHFANHLPIIINTSTYNIEGLKANTTYVLTLINPSAESGLSIADDGKQYLVMTVKPLDATVVINGNVVKADADGVVSTYLPYGEYPYQVMAQGYKPQNGTVNIGREKATLDVTLKSTMATLDVTCVMPGTDIYINGHHEGSGTWHGNLAAGSYNLEAKLEGYRNYSNSISLAENEKRSLTIPALQPISGAINVNYIPANAEVWLDGKKLGTSPDIFRNVDVGNHNMVIRKNGYEDTKIDVTVNENKTVEVSGYLDREIKQATTMSKMPIVTAANKDVKTFIVKDVMSDLTVNDVAFDMVRVDGGLFTMGASKGDKEASKDEKRCHEVSLSTFYIGKTEVTQALWKAVMKSNPSYFKDDDFPIENVSWDEVQIFISKLNSLTGRQFCLPTEAEWEFAARGGNKNRGYKYSGSNSVDTVAWYFGNSGGMPHAVGKKQPNEPGLYDMTGNVWEWCMDLMGNYSKNVQINPIGAISGSGRVVRGGSWFNYIN